MIASVSMLFATPGMGSGTMQGKGMKQMDQEKKCCKKKRMKNKMAQGKMNSPFLIKQGLPHLSKMIMPYLDDPSFNLTAEQKVKLAEVRKSAMTTVMEIKPKVMALREEIISASKSGVSLDVLKEKVAKLALLESSATLTQLKCIEATKAILTKDQMYFLLTNKGERSGKRSMQQKRCKKCIKN